MCFAVLTLFASANRIYEIFDHAQTPDYAKEYRAIAHDIPFGPVAMLCGHAKDISPIERTKLALLDWEIFPDIVLPIDDSMLAGWTGSVVVSSHISKLKKRYLEESFFVPVAGNGSATIWGRPCDSIDHRPCRPEVSRLREVGGMFVVLIILVVIWLFARSDGSHFKVSKLFVALFVFFLLSALALLVGFPAPNGFAVYAGKAKLFLAAGGIPQGFWNDPAFAVCQPSYPIGMVIPAIVLYGISGAFGETWIQVIVPLVLSLLFLEIIGDGRQSLLRTAVALSFVLSPLAIKLAVGYYAEPMAALLIAMGIKALRCKRILRGWALIGMASLFRMECLLVDIAALLSIGSIYLGDNRKGFCSMTRWSMSSVVCLLPGVMWNSFCLVQGAHVQGFDFYNMPSLERVALAGKAMLSAIVAIENGIGASFTLLVGAAFCSLGGRILSQRIFIVFFCSLVVGIVALGFNGSDHFLWILENVAPRYVWLLMSLSVYSQQDVKVDI